MVWIFAGCWIVGAGAGVFDWESWGHLVDLVLRIAGLWGFVERAEGVLEVFVGESLGERFEEFAGVVELAD